MRDFEMLSTAAGASVRSKSWDGAGAQVDAIFRSVVDTELQADEHTCRARFSSPPTP
jgi:hypothetical protein